MAKSETFNCLLLQSELKSDQKVFVQVLALIWTAVPANLTTFPRPAVCTAVPILTQTSRSPDFTAPQV